MINLITHWEAIKKKRVKLNSTSDDFKPEHRLSPMQSFEDNTTHASFELESEPDIWFFKNLSTLEKARYYHELPQIILTPQEEHARQLVIKEQEATNPRFYDGDKIVLSNLAYDIQQNTLYIEAKKVPFSFILTLNQKRFPKDSKLYQQKIFKTGVLAPLIINTGETFLLQRSSDGLFSVPGGFLEPQGRKKKLHLARGNIISNTAYQEIKEEIAGATCEQGKKYQTFYYSIPKISAISFRQTNDQPLETIEFIAPSYADCDSAEFLAQAIEDADDGHEHTGHHVVIPLQHHRLQNIKNRVYNQGHRLPGSALYLPIIASLYRSYNHATQSKMKALRNTLEAEFTGLSIIS
jgi:hypothetical protein